MRYEAAGRQETLTPNPLSTRGPGARERGSAEAVRDRAIGAESASVVGRGKRACGGGIGDDVEAVAGETKPGGGDGSVHRFFECSP